MDLQLIAAAAAAGLFAVLSLGLWARSRGASRRAEALAVELDKLRSAPHEHEYRIEQFDVLWFPTVIFEKGSSAEATAKSGLPHCRKCVTPLKAGDAGEEWACPGCGFKCPASVTDLTVMGTIEKTALQYFCERPPKELRKQV